MIFSLVEIITETFTFSVWALSLALLFIKIILLSYLKFVKQRGRGKNSNDEK